jgi:hypothetical protein
VIIEGYLDDDQMKALNERARSYGTPRGFHSSVYFRTNKIRQLTEATGYSLQEVKGISRLSKRRTSYLNNS